MWAYVKQKPLLLSFLHLTTKGKMLRMVNLSSTCKFLRTGKNIAIVKIIRSNFTEVLP